MDEEARLYQNQMDLAFFVANFNYTKQDYEELTQTERAFVLKAWEDKIVRDTQLVNNAVLNAISNANRKKGRKFQRLWKKKPKQQTENAEMKTAIKAVLEMEEAQGKDWVRRLRR